MGVSENRGFYGLRVFCVGNGVFCYGGLVGFFFATVGVSGFFATVLGGVFATVKGFLATARRVICISGDFLRRQPGFITSAQGRSGAEHQEG